MVNMFTVVLGMLCNSNFRFYLRASRCSEDSADSLPPVIFLNGHNIRPTSCTPCGRFRTLATGYPRSWSRVCTGPSVNLPTYPLVSSSVSNNKLILLIYGCMCIGTLEYIPRYMSRTSNNNKVLINNSSRGFAFRVVYYGNMGHKVYR